MIRQLQAAPSAPISKKKIRVKIVNPLPGGNDSTSLQHAERFVSRGRARFDEQRRLVFINDTEARIISEEIRLLRERAGYDGIERPMTLNELAHIPVVMAGKLLIDRSRGRHSRN